MKKFHQVIKYIKPNNDTIKRKSKSYKVKITDVVFLKNKVIISWVATIGWGQLTLIQKNTNYIIADTEDLGRAFYNQALRAFQKYMFKHSRIKNIEEN